MNLFKKIRGLFQRAATPEEGKMNPEVGRMPPFTPKKMTEAEKAEHIKSLREFANKQAKKGFISFPQISDDDI